jgi:hypothetical protein
MKYRIEAVSIVEKEKPVDMTLLKIILTKNMEKDISVFNILETQIYNRSHLLKYFNPFNAVKELKFVLDKSQRIKEVVNYKEVREQIKKYYTKTAEEMRKAGKDKLEEIFLEMAYETFQYEENIIRELLKMSSFYPFIGGNYRSNSEDNVALEGFLPDYNIVEKLEKIFFRDKNNTYIRGSIDQSKIYAYSLSEQMKELGLEYKPKMLSLESETKIYYKDREIERAESYKEGGIKNYYFKKEKVFISRT